MAIDVKGTGFPSVSVTTPETVIIWFCGKAEN
jgi:hypothetical protein